MASKPVAFEAGSPIHNGHGDDDLDFEKELLEGDMNNGGSNPMLEHSRIEGGDFVPPPQPVRKPLGPPKAPVLSFSEMIAQAAAGLKKNPPSGGDAPKKDNPVPIPKKGGADKEESKKDVPQVRTSNMDALKAQINLRRLAMNPGTAKKGEDGQDD